ncbi:MAG: hypothetical protein JO212_18910 [Acetobacteraceae bacterium]|nr:hypothetical protein [Acetobacteraceae bacterium]
MPLLPVISPFGTDGLVPGGDAAQGSECGVPGASSVKRKKFIELGLELLAA